jgi:hypothetical protein
MELANATRQKADVTVIGMEEVPFEKVLGTSIGKGIQKFYESSGVKFHLKSSILHFGASGACFPFAATWK